MQITASVANLEQESKEMLPAMSASRYRHRVWEGLVQSCKESNLGVYRRVYDGNMQGKEA